MAKPLPTRADLIDYNYAVAGHDGTLCDVEGELFIKPCTQTEINFYNDSVAAHQEFAEFMPAFLGTLTLDEQQNSTIEEQGAALLAKHITGPVENGAGLVATHTNGVLLDDGGAALIAQPTNGVLLDNGAALLIAKHTVPEAVLPVKTGKRIETNQAVVLENAAHGYVKPNILDVKLGVRLWADDAHQEKKIRFDKVTEETTHKDLGFRIAGMRVWQGHGAVGKDIDKEGFQIYDKNYGRFSVQKENVQEAFRNFMFVKNAGIDEELGKLVAQAFLADVRRIQELLENQESRMFSASLLFVFEGDGVALRAAMEEASRSPATLVNGDGCNSEENESEDEEDADPKIYSVKVIDFAHATWSPGLGPDENSLIGFAFLAPVAPEATTVLHHLPANSEWRFEVATSQSIDVKILNGTAEIFGTELALNHLYTFRGTKSSIFTWNGCAIEVIGTCEEYTAEETPMVQYVNTHFALEKLRDETTKSRQDGPRVLVVGPNNSGKTSLVKLLTAYAIKMGRFPMVINTDSKEGMLSIPGTLTASAFSSIIDVEQGWGSSPTSGPGPVPVKLPLCYYYGLPSPEDNTKLFKPVITRLALTSLSRMDEDALIKETGMIIDTPGVISQGKGNYDLISHIISEFSGSERLYSDIQRRFSSYKCASGEPLTLVKLDKSGGCVDRDEAFMKESREAAIREYFFGDLKRILNPHPRNVPFDEIVVHKIFEADPLYEGEEELTGQELFEKVEPSAMMLHSLLAVMHAAVLDSAETIRDATVMGFVYVAEVDEKKRQLKLLAPLNTSFTDKPLVWGSWPEHVMDLMG
ncbi:mRNA cleavage and polyadenylation factor clp1 [Hyphodiscus hymeniophilus]|uniref:Polynucleotide 5'-hydroxyl-kinase GRC3 n=1 Tax=Hyphodiscus hymeniophilus TaxID=353542 RepID=A0A9P6VR72_9HELO|nr:mRNA cleavage and polyadenylation factor clp1 [Hyphodiscus hymeniophilus]